MGGLRNLENENKQLKAQVAMLEQELETLQKELHAQLNLREKELKDVQVWQERYNTLEKRYKALSKSALGGMTLKYWKLRTKLQRR